MRISKKDILIIITFAFLFVSLSGLVEIEWDGCSRIKVECVEGEPCVMPVCATSFFRGLPIPYIGYATPYDSFKLDIFVLDILLLIGISYTGLIIYRKIRKTGSNVVH